jgi:hypothetical protein
MATTDRRFDFDPSDSSGPLSHLGPTTSADVADPTAGVAVPVPMTVRHRTTVTVHRWPDAAAYAAGAPPETTTHVGNLLTTAGATFILQILTGQSFAALDATRSYIGVGSSSQPSTVDMTDLVAPLQRKAVVAGSPGVSGNQATWVAVFSGGEAVGVWNEFGLFTAETGGTMICRSVQNQGTKLSNQVWAAVITIQLL